MFESAEIGHVVDKLTYQTREPKLRKALLDAQYELAEHKRFPVLILIGGVDGAGKGETVNLLNEWMDPRHIQTQALGAASDEERERPPMWRFWRELPPKGRLGIFFGSWYTDPIVRRTYGELGRAAYEARLAEIVRFERMLADEGTLIFKFWFHLGKRQQKARLRELERHPETRWRVSDTDWKHFALYDRFRKISETALRQTSTAYAPWTIVEGLDPRYRSLTVGETLLDGLRRRLDGGQASPATSTAMAAPTPLPPLDGRTLLAALDQTKRTERSAYRDALDRLQGRLNLLVRDRRFSQHALAVVFEGGDAAGKGGAIRRVTQALDARTYRVIPIAAPTEEERAQPYLWRFWRHAPRRGRVTMFDRSWYGRVLVERVEGFCATGDWLRGFSEINDFEEQLAANGTLVVKFWLEISPDEQLRRFEERQATDFKAYKLTPEDWRNREKRPQYDLAVNDMVERTSTAVAPWTLVAADDKYGARLQVLSTLVARLEVAYEAAGKTRRR